MTTTSQDVKLSITTGDYQYFEWMNSPNGIHNMYNRIILAFQNGSLKSFSDSWNRYPIGNVDELLSKEKAIDIAKANLENYSYKVGNETISNLGINEKPDLIIANLTMQPRANVLYPHWEVVLPLDKVYPGFTYGVKVMLWADSGEIISTNAVGSLGFPSEDTISSPAPTTSSTNKPTVNDLNETTNDSSSVVPNLLFVRSFFPFKDF